MNFYWEYAQGLRIRASLADGSDQYTWRIEVALSAWRPRPLVLLDVSDVFTPVLLDETPLFWNIDAPREQLGVVRRLAHLINDLDDAIQGMLHEPLRERRTKEPWTPLLDSIQRLTLNDLNNYGFTDLHSLDWCLGRCSNDAYAELACALPQLTGPTLPAALYDRLDTVVVDASYGKRGLLQVCDEGDCVQMFGELIHDSLDAGTGPFSLEWEASPWAPCELPSELVTPPSGTQAIQTILRSAWGVEARVIALLRPI